MSGHFLFAVVNQLPNRSQSKFCPLFCSSLCAPSPGEGHWGDAQSWMVLGPTMSATKYRWPIIHCQSSQQTKAVKCCSNTHKPCTASVLKPATNPKAHAACCVRQTIRVCSFSYKQGLLKWTFKFEKTLVTGRWDSQSALGAHGEWDLDGLPNCLRRA